MKKIKRALAVAVVLGLLLWVVCFVKQYYTRTAEVVRVEGQEITVEDDNNYQWKFFGEGFKEGQRIKVLMNTNTTNRNVLDDEIVRVIE
jgi:hypothetical protein